MKLSKNDRILCEVIQASVFDKTPIFTSDINWSDVYVELTGQTLAALPGDLLLTMEGLEDSLRISWKRVIAIQVGYRQYYLYIQNMFLEQLRSHRIPVVVIKGTAASRYYPKPEYRTMGDVDFLVHPSRVKEAEAVLKSLGCETEYRNHSHYNHIRLLYDGVEIELHWSFDISTHKEQISEMDQCILEGLEFPEWFQDEEYRIPMLPKLQNGLVLLQHIRQHLREGIGLRQIVDWMLYVNENLDDGFWRLAFQKKAVSFGLEQLAMTLTRMCQLYLGLPTDHISWCIRADEVLCNQLLKYILESGNMGNKHKEETNHVRTFIGYKGGILEAIKQLQLDGENTWPVLKRHHWLRPFAWLYRIARSALRLIQYHVSLRQLYLYHKEGKQQAAMLRKLGVIK
ncbi:MAG: nucleotidyltransferase family protein [Lachnospiraceae bacterium]|nr:nucleotidyltransferase family protein [Lachnospiraceae bacterium]